jgi:hypothetical protein
MEKESAAIFYFGAEYGTHCCQPAIPSFSAHLSTISRSFIASSGVFSQIPSKLSPNRKKPADLKGKTICGWCNRPAQNAANAALIDSVASKISFGEV